MGSSTIKAIAKMMGIDLNSATDQVVPAIINMIDDSLADIKLNDDESKALVIVADGHGSYRIVKTVFDSQAHEHMHQQGHEKLDNLVKNIINSIL